MLTYAVVATITVDLPVNFLPQYEDDTNALYAYLSTQWNAASSTSIEGNRINNQIQALVSQVNVEVKDQEMSSYSVRSPHQKSSSSSSSSVWTKYTLEMILVIVAGVLVLTTCGFIAYCRHYRKSSSVVVYESSAPPMKDEFDEIPMTPVQVCNENDGIAMTNVDVQEICISPRLKAQYVTPV